MSKCKWCGKELPQDSKSRFCSEQCANTHVYRHDTKISCKCGREIRVPFEQKHWIDVGKRLCLKDLRGFMDQYMEEA